MKTKRIALEPAGHQVESVRPCTPPAPPATATPAEPTSAPEGGTAQGAEAGFLPFIQWATREDRRAFTELLVQAIRLRRTNPRDEASPESEQAWEVLGDLDRAVDFFLERNPQWRSVDSLDPSPDLSYPPGKR